MHHRYSLKPGDPGARRGRKLADSIDAAAEEGARTGPVGTEELAGIMRDLETEWAIADALERRVDALAGNSAHERG
jgi:hypothetical protein